MNIALPRLHQLVVKFLPARNKAAGLRMEAGRSGPGKLLAAIEFGRATSA